MKGSGPDTNPEQQEGGNLHEETDRHHDRPGHDVFPDDSGFRR
jgi:hypothetical protein